MANARRTNALSSKPPAPHCFISCTSPEEGVRTMAFPEPLGFRFFSGIMMSVCLRTPGRASILYPERWPEQRWIRLSAADIIQVLCLLAAVRVDVARLNRHTQIDGQPGLEPSTWHRIFAPTAVFPRRTAPITRSPVTYTPRSPLDRKRTVLVQRSSG